jgi:MATE family multidrug resistance protein
VVDCLQAATIAALRAYHDTMSAPKIQMVAYWLIGLPIAIVLGFYSDLPGISGPHGFWIAMLVSLSISGLWLLRRLLKVLKEPV